MSSRGRIKRATAETHADGASRIDAQKSLKEQSLDEHADVDTAVDVVFLLRAWRDGSEAKPELVIVHPFKVPSNMTGLADVGVFEGVIVEGELVNQGDDKERPMRTTLGHPGIGIVVDGKEYVGGGGEVRECVADRPGIGNGHDHIGHAGPEKHDPSLGVVNKFFTLKIPEEVRFEVGC